MPEHRFFVSPEELAGAAASPEPGGIVPIRGPEHHHLHRVLRLRAGDEVGLFDGAGHGFLGVIESIGKEESLVRLTSPDVREVEPAYRLTLAQGIPHHDKMDLIIQKATEIGVWSILPIVGERTAVNAGSEGSWKRLDRWRRIARDAARQSGRLRVPEIHEPVSWSRYDDRAAAGVDRCRYILSPGGDRSAPGAPEPVSRVSSAVIAVGPEGGWTDEEIAMARGRGFREVWLGPRVLRTETAGIVAVTLLLFLAGDLGGATSPQSFRASG